MSIATVETQKAVEPVLLSWYLGSGGGAELSISSNSWKQREVKDPNKKANVSKDVSMNITRHNVY